MIVRVELRRVGKAFGSVVALRGIEAVFEKGQTTVLAGHNGAGKSTLLSLLSTLAQPSTGEVTFDGRPAAAWGGGLRAAIGFAAEEPLAYGELTCLENISFFAQAQGVRPVRERAAAMVELLGLSKVAHRPVAVCSQGERRRIGLARALVHDPSLLLLDEPTSGLDLAGARRLVEIVGAVPRRGGIVVVATHDPWLAEQLGGRLLALRQGQVVSQGEQPRTMAEWRQALGDSQ